MATKNPVTYLIGEERPLNAVSVWNKGGLDVSNKYSTAGGLTVGALSRKAWKSETSSALTGNALKRAHNSYLRELGLAANAYVAGLIAEGKVLCSSIGVNKSGKTLTVKLANAATIVDPSASVSAEVKEAKSTGAKTGKMEAYAELLAAGTITKATYDSLVVALA